MSRPYVRMTTTMLARLEEWYRDYLRIGTFKTIGRELGISPRRVEALIGKLRKAKSTQ